MATKPNVKVIKRSERAAQESQETAAEESQKKSTQETARETFPPLVHSKKVSRPARVCV